MAHQGDQEVQHPEIDINCAPLLRPSPRRRLIGWLLGFISLWWLVAFAPVDAVQAGIDWTVGTGQATLAVAPWAMTMASEVVKNPRRSG